MAGNNIKSGIFRCPTYLKERSYFEDNQEVYDCGNFGNII
jgi:hypothetical protein